MSAFEIQSLEQSFYSVCEGLLARLGQGEHLTIALSAERSQFVRFNGAKVRQTGFVIDGMIDATLIQGTRQGTFSFGFSGDTAFDIELGQTEMAALRSDLQHAPEDPYLVLPSNAGTSRTHARGNLPSPGNVAQALFGPAAGLDYTGIFVSGSMVRALVNSAGTKHWFATESFYVDFSLCHKSGKAVKSVFAGTQWDQQKYDIDLKAAAARLKALDLPQVTLKPGKYRVYLEPAATGELLNMFSWGGVSESAIRQKESAFCKLSEGVSKFSPLFSLSENFALGLVPRFNDRGDLAPVTLEIIKNGALVNTLVNVRTAKEYGLESNGAHGSEGLRAAEIAGGKLPSADALKALGTGVYVSNLHYLNWSDRPNGRITGMTRHACFWVENGAIKGPINDMRFDESLYTCLGPNLEAVTVERELQPETMTYGKRHLGGSMVPGLLVKDFAFTL